MYRFIESLWYENDHYPLLSFHQNRVNKVFENFYPKGNAWFLHDLLPKPSIKGKVKVRFLYNEHQHHIEWSAYHSKTIEKLKVIYNDDIDYTFKYTNRQRLEELFGMKGHADDIIIIKNGLVTDSFYANLIFWDGHKWLTPSTCLLEGVMRAKLLKEGVLFSREIYDYELPWFEKIGLINALNEAGQIIINPDNGLLFQ